MRPCRLFAAALAAALLTSACVRSAPVLDVEVVSEDGRQLLVEVDSCRAGLSIETDENEERVRIAVRARGGQGDCTTPFTLTLEEPLGDREVVDAVTGDTIEVER